MSNERLKAEIERLQREWDEDLKSVTLQWELWEESDKAKDAKIERLQRALEDIRDLSSPEGWTVRDCQEYAAEVLEDDND